FVSYLSIKRCKVLRSKYLTIRHYYSRMKRELPAKFLIPKDRQRGGIQNGHPLEISTKLRPQSPRGIEYTKNTEVLANIQERFWHTTIVPIPERFRCPKNVRSRRHSRSPRLPDKRSVARATASARRMVVAMGRIQVRLWSRAHPLAEAPRWRSARWHVSVSRHARQ